MGYRFSKNDPMFYKIALRGLIDEAKENGVTVTLQGNRVVFDDRKEFMGNMAVSAVCSVELEVQE